MKKDIYTEEQVAFTLQQAERGTPVAETCHKLGVTEESFCRWKINHKCVYLLYREKGISLHKQIKNGRNT
ncbi:MAG: transposase [Clostridiales bacterium]|nr:transposase [Clostridiales bacterium]